MCDQSKKGLSIANQKKVPKNHDFWMFGDKVERFEAKATTNVWTREFIFWMVGYFSSEIYRKCHVPYENKSSYLSCSNLMYRFIISIWCPFIIHTLFMNLFLQNIWRLLGASVKLNHEDVKWPRCEPLFELCLKPNIQMSNTMHTEVLSDSRNLFTSWLRKKWKKISNERNERDINFLQIKKVHTL